MSGRPAMSAPDPRQLPETLMQPAMDAGQPAAQRTAAANDAGSLAEHLDQVTMATRHMAATAAEGTMTRARYEGWADGLAEVHAWIRDHPEQCVQLPAGLVIRPGDKLVLGFREKLTPSMIDRLGEATSARLPGVKVVVFDGVSHMAVYRDAES